MNNGSRVHKMSLFCIENRRTEEDRHFAETCAEHFIHVAKQLNNFKHFHQMELNSGHDENYLQTPADTQGCPHRTPRLQDCPFQL